MNCHERKIVKIVLDSMNTNPETWVVNEYRATNERLGVEVWIANKHYGLSISCGGVNIGGVTLASCFFGSLTPWRRRVLSAVRQIQLDKVAVAARQLAAA